MKTMMMTIKMTWIYNGELSADHNDNGNDNDNEDYSKLQLLSFQLMNFIKPGTCDMKKVVDKVKLDGLAPQKQHFEVRKYLKISEFPFALR